MFNLWQNVYVVWGLALSELLWGFYKAMHLKILKLSNCTGYNDVQHVIMN